MGYRTRVLSSACLLSGGCATATPAQTIAITGGTVYPVSSAPIPNGTVLIRDGKIVAVGEHMAIPGDARHVDATGKIVTPGLIDAITTLGVNEIEEDNTTRDVTATGRDNIAATFHVWEGLNSESVLFGPTRNEGVTSVVVAPTGGLIAGQAAVIDLVDGHATQMLQRTAVAMMAQVNSPLAAGAGARGEIIARLRTLFDDVRYYQAHRLDYDRNQTPGLAASRAELEALIPVIQGRLPLAITANRVDDIEEALRLARDYRLKVMIVGGAEAWLVADQLAAANVPVLTGAMNNIPRTFETLNQRQENAALLRHAGVRVSLIGNVGDGGEDAYNVRDVKYEAGNAVAYGMSHDEALRAVTLTPAEIFGVDAHIGSLQPGRDANIVIWSGDPFEFSTRVEHVFIRGRDVRAEKSRQDLLGDRYRAGPPVGMH